MTAEKMPERIFLDTCPFDVEQPGCWYVGSENRGLVTEPVEYVRAGDIAIAAPDMYAALRRAKSILRMTGVSPSALKVINSALEKARGEV